VLWHWYRSSYDVSRACNHEDERRAHLITLRHRAAAAPIGSVRFRGASWFASRCVITQISGDIRDLGLRTGQARGSVSRGTRPRERGKVMRERCISKFDVFPRPSLLKTSESKSDTVRIIVILQSGHIALVVPVTTSASPAQVSHHVQLF
jgi:hypothetical protein